MADRGSRRYDTFDHCPGDVVQFDGSVIIPGTGKAALGIQSPHARCVVKDGQEEAEGTVILTIETD